MVIVVAFLLEANITDVLSNSLVEAMASKTQVKLVGIVDKIGSTAKFLTANNAQHAELTLMLKATSNMLEGVSSFLDALTFKLVSPPSAPPSSLWTSIAKAMPTNLSPLMPHQAPTINLLSMQEMLIVQQHQLQDACMILVGYNPNNTNTLKDLTATGSSTLHSNLNKLLEQLDTKSDIFCQGNGKIDVILPKTRVIGLKAIRTSAYLAELDNVDSAYRFYKHLSIKLFHFDNVLMQNVIYFNLC
ncbi:hypothetical protein C0993_002550 [Termitomyces sp. T159_Od127]|nr:hypothetical protein C0993_002550 [Termitomyces sp. T159_Od127]